MGISSLELEVDRRSDTGKNACRRLRAGGRIPGNVYGLDRPPFMVAVDPRKIDDVIRSESGANTIFMLALTGDKSKREAMIKELQRDPISGRPIHVDFVRIDPKQAIQVAVPVRLLGVAEGVKNEGGLMDFVHREVLLECLPADIPEHLDVDVSELHINQHVAVKDLPLGERINILDDPEQILAVVVAPKVDEELDAEEAAAEAAAAEGEEAAEAPAEGADAGGGDKDS